MKLFYVETDYGCGIRAGKSLSEVERAVKREEGIMHFKSARIATDADINWVRGMGGYVPQVGKKVSQ